MLPFLPALILLFLQGPSSPERTSAHMRTGEAVRAIQLAATHRSLGSISSRTALASWVAASQDPDVAQALIELFQAIQSPKAPIQNLPAEMHPATFFETPAKTGLDALRRLQRSRDGPASIA